MKHWVFQIAIKDRSALGAVRCFPGLMVKEKADGLWLELPKTTEQVPREIRKLPLQQTFTLDAEGNLFPVGKQTPIATNWQLTAATIAEFMPVSLPVSAFPAQVDRVFRSKLVSSDRERQVVGLLANWEPFLHYVSLAAKARLGKLQFAVSENREVLVLGGPVPTIPGQALWSMQEVLLPAGLDFEYSGLLPLFKKKYLAKGGAFGLFREDGSWERIDKDAFQAVTRSAVRITDKTLKGNGNGP